MRTKIVAGNLVAVLVVGLVSYFVVGAQMRSTLLNDVDSRIATDHQMIGAEWRLAVLELGGLVSEQAQSRQVVDVFSATSEGDQRGRANQQADRIADWLSRQGDAGRPELVVVTNDAGAVIARDHDPNRMLGEPLAQQLPTITRALAGEVTHDVWAFNSGQTKLLQVAAAPIHDPNGHLLGVLLVGYDMSNGMAHRLGLTLGRDVVFVQRDSVYSSSLDGTLADNVRARLLTDQGTFTRAALAAPVEEATDSPPFLAQIGDHQYAAVVGRLPMSSTTPVAFAVLADRTAQADKLSPINTILFMTALGVLIVLVYGFFIGTMFLRPIAQLEEGILAVINGRSDLRLDIESSELGGLAYRINQLLNILTGTPEEDEEGRVSSPPGQWTEEAESAARAQVPGAPAAPAADDESVDPAEAAKLAAEPEDAYYTRVYREYVDAKKAVGEDVSNVPQDRFAQRLQANEKQLVKKHGCRMVRFQVQTRGSQVNLRPVIIR